MAPIGDRIRDAIWAHPGRARAAVAGVVLTAVASGAFVAVRPDNDAGAARLRHRQYAGATGGDSGTRADDVEAGTAPAEAAATDGSSPGGASPAGSGPTTPGAPTGTSGTGTSSSSPGGSAPGIADGAASTSTDSSGGGADPVSGTRPVPTTRPTGTTRTGTPAGVTIDAPGWAMLPKAPIGARGEHTAVWTGREMVIWGGIRDYEADPLTDGAAYDPAAGTWRKLPPAPLAPRAGARAVWTGREMLVFGGTVGGDVVADGAAWDPATNSWRAIPASPIGPRDGAVVAWAGDRLVIWSGTNILGSDAAEDAVPEVKNDGSAYVPATDSWVPIGPAPIPPRNAAESAWTGTRLVVTGGQGEIDDRTDGAAFDPASGTWSPIADRPTPGSCGGDIGCNGFWTGETVLFPASEVSYDPAADRWTTLAPVPVGSAPAPGEPTVWSGRRLLAWGIPGGDDGSGADTADSEDGVAPTAAAMYDPAANGWQSFPVGPLRGRTVHTAVWTGEVMLVWGGIDDVTPLADGAAYRPQS